MIKWIFSSLLLFIITTRCCSQRTLLMLQKKNKNKIVYYQPGDIISFRIKDYKSKIEGEILGFEDSVIVFKGAKRVHVNEIASFCIDEKTKWWIRFKPAQLLLLGGSVYLIVILNTGELSRETLMISGVSIGAGLLAKLFITNQIKNKRKN